MTTSSKSVTKAQLLTRIRALEEELDTQIVLVRRHRDALAELVMECRDRNIARQQSWWHRWMDRAGWLEDFTDRFHAQVAGMF